MDMHHAFTALRNHARTHNLRLSDVARTVAEGTADLSRDDPLQRTISHRTADNGSLLREEHTLAFRLTPGCERGAAELGVTSGTRIRVELLDDGGHLLDSRTYHAR
jgi:hypothetical protein